MRDESREVKSCRTCGSKSLAIVMDLGNQWVVNFPTEEEGVSSTAPLQLVLCQSCSLLQLHHTYSRDSLYRQYWYRSGVNRSMIEALRDVVESSMRRARLHPGDFVLDIGANDGTLLGHYPPWVRRVGFEPARNLAKFWGGLDAVMINDYFNYDAWKRAFGDSKAKIITAIAMFYDLDNPSEFLLNIKRTLHPDGIFVIQQNYLVSMLERNQVDNICHEHLNYYSMLSLENLLNRHELEVFDVELNEVNGGSFRTYVQHAGGPYESNPNVEELRKKEQKMGLNNIQTYVEFARKLEGVRRSLRDFIEGEVRRGRRVWVYGASTRGSTLLQFCGLDNKLIEAAADRNPDKWGRHMVGTNIPIRSEEEGRAANPDYFLVLPYHFLPEFLEREHRYLAGGGRFIVPLPTPRVVGENGKVEAVK